MIKRYIVSFTFLFSFTLLQASQQIQTVVLGEKEKEAISGALRQMFYAQQAASQEYVGIVQAVRAAMENPQVVASAQKVITDLKDVARIFAQNIKLDDAQAAKMHDFAQTLHEVASMQKQLGGLQGVDQAAISKMQQLQSKLATHMIPVAMAADEVYKGQDTSKLTQDYLASLIATLLAEFIAQMPKSVAPVANQSKPVLSEPVMPEQMPMVDVEDAV